MIDSGELLAADEKFFEALISGDIDALCGMLTDDFIIVDVMTGTPATKEALIGAMRSNTLAFSAVQRDPDDAIIRIYESVGIIVNQTVLHGSFSGATFETRSRYTHVFIQIAGQWRMVSAQGTRIVEG